MAHQLPLKHVRVNWLLTLVLFVTYVLYSARVVFEQNVVVWEDATKEVELFPTVAEDHRSGLDKLPADGASHLLVSASFSGKQDPSTNEDASSAVTIDQHLNNAENKCRVAVTNSKPTHYETLESIAALLPLHFISSAHDCITWEFDYHIYAEGERYQSWVTYFRDNVQGKSYTRDRRVGKLVLHTELPSNGIIDPNAKDNSSYHAVVEASCYCRGGKNNHVKWFKQNDNRTCIFHEKCPRVAQHERALWLSPHHDKHYYIPTRLPLVVKETSQNQHAEPSLCVVGGTKRRNWGLLKIFLDTQRETPFRIKVIGFGDYPAPLETYRSIVTMSSPVDYYEFHEQIATSCDAILMLVTKESHANYFHGPGSLLKLSGVIPLSLAYEIPTVMHEELYDLYQKDFPEHLHVSTHSDEPESFVRAVRQLLSTRFAKP